MITLTEITLTGLVYSVAWDIGIITAVKLWLETVSCYLATITSWVWGD